MVLNISGVLFAEEDTKESILSSVICDSLLLDIPVICFMKKSRFRWCLRIVPRFIRFSLISFCI